MLRSTITLAFMIGVTLIVSYQAKAGEDNTKDCPQWLDMTLHKLHSKETVDLCSVVTGHPLLIVNTASHCGYTKQFSGLEALHQDFQDMGLVIIGFPSNSFNQEASSEAKTASVCFKNFGVTFLMSKPVNVRGEDAHPVFKHLNQQRGEPSWNFNKYLVSPNGEVLKRYESSVTPSSQRLRNDIRTQFSL
ncbi:glutathione peroxidase [Bermanella marisrubri]|uniref:Glutathione peroxidase n=1 Tax=Bermanella marisrubri TaxID=207949 RepID=Q1MZA4_9GAMM|nr:glutathione peroxidase [Bermanella marisrubri]EAT11362.1 glutathione peroxidase, putative [Oceanobacter sp. RED65] [Bermanella marisrubri]QIZ85252.1 glutathione peroxidase [Bermanella marisrubri]